MPTSKMLPRWQPLPHIYSGFVIHPFNPTPPTTPESSRTPIRNRFSWSGVGATPTLEVGGRANPYEISLDVGDEFFAFEEYSTEEEVWYRGYVVQAMSLQQLTPVTTPYPRPEPSVLIGIFPSSVVHIRPGAPNDSGELGPIYEKAQQSLSHRMEAVQEEEETPFRVNRPPSLTIASLEDRPQPPLPKLTAGDATVAGQQYPLIDEISCAIREWYGRLPTYLANRDYRLFDAVTQHIDALFLGRRQLLSQTLSSSELARVRRECVSRLVKCNVAQGLEVIVRSLEDGSVMVVDPERAVTGASWVSGITCYVYQVQLAYIDLIPLDTLFGNSLLSPQPFSLAAKPLPTPTASPNFHCCLDVRAFVASPCAPGETAELYFSLYNKTESRFVTEEYCLVLNHLGSPARDSEQRLGRLRTLFTDLKQEDVSDPIYLVCRLVRNGAMKMNPASSGDLSRIRLSASTYTLNHSEDSFSVTSGFGGRRESIIEPLKGAFRRPLGCAVLELAQLSKLDDTHEFTMPIFLPREEATFATLHEDIIHDRTKEYEKSPRTESIAVSLRLFKGTSTQLVHEHPSLLAGIPLTARLGFPDVVYPGTDRNDLYIKLWSGSFSPPLPSSGSMRNVRKSVSSSQNNVQITLEVRRSDGTVIPDVITAGGSGEHATSTYNSLVFHHNDRPTFGELVKISLPTTDCHLFLTFRSRRESAEDRPFAIGYLPLYSSTSCIKDGLHNLVLYRMEKLATPNTYLDAAPVEGDLPPIKGMTPLKDRMVLRSFMCSSSHTQDDTLRALFSWQQKPASDLSKTLQLFSFVPEEELSKFVHRALDSLFSIIVANVEDESEINNLVFTGLVKVLSMTSDRRFPNFDSVLDVYISNYFNYPAASFLLLRTMKSISPSTKEYRSFIKVWHLIFRFIIRSRELDRAKGFGLDATSAHIEADFQKQTKAILGDINDLMKSTDPAVIGTQTLAVQHYSDVLPYLSQVFPPLEIAEMVIAFADTLSTAKGSIAVYKLLLLLQVVKTVFNTSECRALLIPAMVRWVKPHLGQHDSTSKTKWLECNRLAVTVIAWTVNNLQEWLASPLISSDESLLAQEEDNLEYCLSLLPALLASYSQLSSDDMTDVPRKPTPDVFPVTHPFALVSQLPPQSLLERHQQANDDDLPSPGIFKCGQAEAAVVILTLVLACPQDHLTRWLEETLEVDGAASFSSTLQTTFAFCQSVIAFEAFPRQWLTLSLMSFSSIIKLLTSITAVMEDRFIPDIKAASEFDAPLWNHVFRLLCEFCGSEELALEDQTQQRRRAEWIIAGDLRDQGANLLLRLWNAIGWPVDDGHLRYGGYQTRFTSLAERILGLCLSSHDQMCETAVEILFSMIYAEYVLEGKFDTIENEIFSKLDKLFSQKSSTDPTMRAYFVAQLRAVFESSPEIDAKFHSKVATFLDEVELFIDLLLALRDLPETIEWKDERSAAVYRLMDFVRRIGRLELYVRFVHQLVQINIDSRDWLGAGLALKLHADMLDWNDSPLEPTTSGIPLPAQTQFARKEAIYRHVLGHLVDGEAYEIALQLSQELATQHQKFTFDPIKITELLTYQAGLWEKIGQSSRHYPEYFRLAFYGPFPSMIKGKEFVVRGRPWQKYADFYESIQHKYPEASLHRQKSPPIEMVRDGPEQIIWVTTVTPAPLPTKAVFTPGVPDSIQSYWKNNGVNRFESLRPYYRDPEDDEPVLQWVEKAVITTAEELPHVLSRTEVVNIAYEHISPLTTAISEIAKATNTIQTLSKRYQTLAEKVQNPDTKSLDGILQSAVSSPVQGGVPHYRKTFLEDDYLVRHPREADLGDTLRAAILDYVRAVQEALKVHRSVCGSKMISFNDALERLFAKSFSEEISVLPKVPTVTVSPTSPTTPTAARPSTLPPTLSPQPYTLPPLRLGPTPGSSALGTLRPAPSIPTTPLSKHQSESRRSSDLSLLAKSSNSNESHSNGNNGTPSFPRSKSLVDSLSGRLRSPNPNGAGNGNGNGGSTSTAHGHNSSNGHDESRSASPLSRSGSEGTIGDLRRQGSTATSSGKGLKRFGSLLKRSS